MVCPEQWLYSLQMIWVQIFPLQNTVWDHLRTACILVLETVSYKFCSILGVRDTHGAPSLCNDLHSHKLGCKFRNIWRSVCTFCDTIFLLLMHFHVPIHKSSAYFPARYTPLRSMTAQMSAVLEICFRNSILRRFELNLEIIRIKKLPYLQCYFPLIPFLSLKFVPKILEHLLYMVSKSLTFAQLNRYKLH